MESASQPNGIIQPQSSPWYFCSGSLQSLFRCDHMVPVEIRPTDGDRHSLASVGKLASGLLGSGVSETVGVRAGFDDDAALGRGPETAILNSPYRGFLPSSMPEILC